MYTVIWIFIYVFLKKDLNCKGVTGLCLFLPLGLFVLLLCILFFYFEHDDFLVLKKTEISDNHVSGYSRHGGTLM